MNNEERRLILDRGFDRALEVVLSTFLEEGFSVDAVDAGNLRRPQAAGCARRYAVVAAAPPELIFSAQPRTDSPALLGCRVSMFELTDSCTLVTVARPIARYPMLTTLVPRVAERLERVIRALVRTGVLTAA